MSIKVDGKTIAQELQEELAQQIKARGKVLSLAVFVLAEDLATEKFIALKKRFAEAVGVGITLIRLSAETTTESLVAAIVAAGEAYDGIIVQFPLPSHIDRDAVRNAVPVGCDVDLVSDAAVLLFERGASVILPPVVGAIDEILRRYEVSLTGRRVVVVGEGRLVGKPAAAWARLQGGVVQVVNEHTEYAASVVKEAEILILGAGVPGLIAPEMITEGVVIIDAGTSEAAGKLAGDMQSQCVEKASLYTPVPGGVGPVTVAMIFKNLLKLAEAAG